MPTLPTTTAAFASSATEAQFKTFLTGQREFLAGLLGTDGTAVTAKATLGVNDGVTSVNGNTGAITAEQIAAAATAGYGYTPADSTHSHSYAPTDARQNVVGGLAVGYCQGTQTSTAPGAGTTYTPSGTMGNTYLGTTLSYSWLVGFAMSGTWRCIGSFANAAGEKGGLFQRIA